MQKYFKHLDRVSYERTDFGMLDSKGRQVGALVAVDLVEVAEVTSKWTWPDEEAAPLPVGSRILCLHVQAARNGRAYGASRRDTPIGDPDDPSTAAKLAAEIDRRINAMKKRLRADIVHKLRHGMTRGQRR